MTSAHDVSVIFCLVMPHVRLIRHDLKQLRHAAIFVRQDVAVLHVQTCEINEAGPERKVAGFSGKTIRTQYHFSSRILFG